MSARAEASVSTARADAPADLAAAAAAACRRLLGVEAAPAPTAPLPAGYKRRQMNSVKLVAGNVILIASRRHNASYGRREAETLLALGREHAPAPRLLAAEGEWLIQEYVGHTRLSEKLHRADAREAAALMEAAAQALWRCQDAGARARLGAPRDSLEGYRRLLAAPTQLGDLLKAKAPEFPREAMLAAITAPERAFIKWDARPANAVLGDDGTVFWIDWEEWGLRCRLDDLVWLVCDEWTPDLGEAEDAFVARHVRDRNTAFADARAAQAYYDAYGALHLLIRAGVILTTKGAGGWWDAEECLAHEVVGVTRPCVARLLGRAARLAARAEATKPLAAWIATLPERLPA